MNQQTLRTFAMVSLLLALTAISVSAQSGRSKINIPFSFIVDQKTLPAGEYTVERNRRDSDKVWLIQSSDGHAGVYVMTMFSHASKTQEKLRLVFHQYGAQYFLSQIWTPGGNTGHELSMPRQERELAKNAVKGQTVALIAGSKD
jgi:hypothetical protein